MSSKSEVAGGKALGRLLLPCHDILIPKSLIPAPSQLTNPRPVRFTLDICSLFEDQSDTLKSHAFVEKW